MNEVIGVDVAAQHGGRIIRYFLGDHDYLWANPELSGQFPPANGLGPNDTWLDWGGDKLWPAPQGWSGPEQWPGPPDSVLDGSPHSIETLQDSDDEVAVRLSSQSDPRSGIQLGRVIRISSGSSIVRIRASMTNVDERPRRWGIWTTTQLNGAASEGPGINPKLKAYIPINPSSHFPRGYTVLYGRADNPQFKVDSKTGLMCVHYRRMVGKIGMDSAAGWAATVDGTSGFVFVQGFSFEPGREYPDGSSVEYWSNGLGRIQAWGKEIEMPADSAKNPLVVESELISPFANLQPGERYEFDYEWRACQIGGDYLISACSGVGCTAKAFRIERRAGRDCQFFGRFGVFHVGEMRVTFRDSDEEDVGHPHLPSAPVTPMEPLVLEDLFQTVRIPDEATVVVLSIHDRGGAEIGELERANVGE
jgi:hypothetical protein